MKTNGLIRFHLLYRRPKTLFNKFLGRVQGTTKPSGVVEQRGLPNEQRSALMELGWVIAIVIVAGAAGGFVNVFIGDNGLHLPYTDPTTRTFQPGFLATVIIGALAALGSWGMTKAVAIGGAQTINFSTSDIASALLIGFGGAKWFKSETEKDVLQKTAAVAASKEADPETAATIATANPHEALLAAMKMK